MKPVNANEFGLIDRMVDAVERVRERLMKAAGALSRGGVPYAVVGGNAVAAWVSSVDRAAARATQDVDILIRRESFDAARAALEGAGFVYRRSARLDIFLDHEGASPREGVHVVFANETIKPGEPAPSPDVSESVQTASFALVTLEALVRIKLTAFRDKDRTHLRDLIGVGLVDQSWTANLPAVLAERLQSILDTPEG